jgi:hypothetical protein
MLTFLNDRHTLLAGQSEHSGDGRLIPGKIEFLNGDPFSAKELFRGLAPRSGG